MLIMHLWYMLRRFRLPIYVIWPQVFETYISRYFGAIFGQFWDISRTKNQNNWLHELFLLQTLCSQIRAYFGLKFTFLDIQKLKDKQGRNSGTYLAHFMRLWSSFCIYMGINHAFVSCYYTFSQIMHAILFFLVV